MDDIRWLQRFEHYKKALAELNEGLVLLDERELSKLEKQGLIKTFEFTYELAVNVLKDFLIWQSSVPISGSRDAIRASFKVGLIDDGHLWIDMLKDRNRTVHTYNKKTAEAIVDAIKGAYHQAFLSLEQVFLDKQNNIDEL